VATAATKHTRASGDDATTPTSRIIIVNVSSTTTTASAISIVTKPQCK
jgi:hypothetical protein